MSPGEAEDGWQARSLTVAKEKRASASPQMKGIKWLPFPFIRPSVKLGIKTDMMAYGNHTAKGPEWCFYKAHTFWKLLCPPSRKPERVVHHPQSARKLLEGGRQAQSNLQKKGWLAIQFT